MNSRIVLLILASITSLVGSALGAWWFLIQPSRYKQRFERKGTKRVVLVTTFFITGIVTLIAGFSGDFKPSGGLNYRVRVVDTFHRPIQQAKVTIEGQGIPLIAYTDFSGAFTYPPMSAGIVRITVEAPCYERYEDYVLFPSKDTEIVLMKSPLQLSGHPRVSIIRLEDATTDQSDQIRKALSDCGYGDVTMSARSGAFPERAEVRYYFSSDSQNAQNLSDYINGHVKGVVTISNDRSQDQDASAHRPGDLHVYLR